MVQSVGPIWVTNFYKLVQVGLVANYVALVLKVQVIPQFETSWSRISSTLLSSVSITNTASAHTVNNNTIGHKATF